MYQFNRIVLSISVILLAVSTALPNQPTQATDDGIVLSVAIPSGIKSLVVDAVATFEQEHADIKVNIVNKDIEAEPAVNDLDKHLQDAENLVRSADVVFVDSYTLSPESTTAGYFLDLKPLVQADSALNADTYMSVAWESIQWNGGIWAFPSTVTANLLIYDRAAFDKAGVTYPSEQWTIDDLDKAVRQLAERDGTGKVIRPGIAFTAPLSQANLIRSLLGSAPFETDRIPHFAGSNTLEHILTVLTKLNEDGLIGTEPEEAVMSPCCIHLLLPENNPDNKWAAALIPGGHSTAIVQSFAVSAGTLYPEQAYALARTLSQTVQLDSYFIDTVSAYKNTTTTAIQANSRYKFPTEVYDLWMQALNRGISQVEFQYFSYIAIALNKIAEGSSITTALQTAEQAGIDAIKQAADHKANTVIAVATPIPAKQLSTNEVSLKFGLVFPTGFRGIPNKALWDNLIADFIESDPQVKAITLDMSFQPTKNGDDCYYGLGSPARVPDLSRFFYSLDPFISTDSSFDKADVLEGALAMISTDNKIWAYPLTIEPMVLSYDPEALDKAGITLPDGTWTAAQFTDALKQLRPEPDTPPVFGAPADPGNGTHLLMLVAAYGGLPLDFRTEPPIVNFTDPVVIDAIRQVLDLVKQGYIQYGALGNFAQMKSPATLEAPIRVQMLNTLAMAFTRNNASNTKPTGIMLFPGSTTQQVIAYDVGVAYIINTTPNPDACYRWISTIARHPELFNAMPATYSAINSPALEVTQGSDAVATYRRIAELLKTPDVIRFPLAGRSFLTFISTLFLYRAFDSYVLDNGDLQVSLKDAELKAKTFQECAMSIAPFDVSDPQGEQVFLKAIDRCVTAADPSMSGMFAPR